MLKSCICQIKAAQQGRPRLETSYVTRVTIKGLWSRSATASLRPRLEASVVLHSYTCQIEAA